MTLETLAWFVEELGFPALEDSGKGGFEANGPARSALSGKEPASLEAAVIEILQANKDQAARIEELIQEARQGSRGSLMPHPGLRVMTLPLEDGRARVILGGLGSSSAEALQARAAAADLAAGVSHEVSNALSAIIGWSRVSRERPDKAPPEEALLLIENSAQAARDAAQDLLRMVRSRSDDEESRTDVALVVRDVVRLLRPEALRRRVKVLQESDTPCWIQGTRSQVFSIIWNLAHNAIQLVPPGGFAELNVQLKGDLVVLEVRDNGPGMSSEQKDKIFDPYFTTRSGGTGLGLVIVRDTVSALGGEIRLDTSPGEGAKFRIELPHVGRKLDSKPVRRPKRISRVMEPSTGGQLHVLVVEDDDGVRGLIETTLDLGGVKSTCVASAKEALRQEGPFDAAVVDLNLPDNRGDLVLAMLRDRGILSHAILMSGGPPPEDLDVRGRPDRWLRKPFDPADFMICVRELLEAHLQPAQQAVT